ncbi:hypothetical protein C8Q80DRAFT_1259743 [Daedaleopsis nitida]|nr:hypothetical protein C8Q80DRAFT_1259743 [Daedaleopsis nitida]
MSPGPKRSTRRHNHSTAGPTTKTGRAKTAGTPCTLCGRLVAPQGYANHYKKCSQDHTLAQYEAEYEASKVAGPSGEASRRGAGDPHDAVPPSNNEHQGHDYEMGTPPRTPSPATPDVNMAIPLDAAAGDAPGTPGNLAAGAGDEDGPQADDIRVEYHPNSGRGTHVYRFGEFTRAKKPYEAPLNEEPWRPAFHSRVDYEFAEFALAAALKEEQIDKLIKLIRTVEYHQDEFTFNTHTDVRKSWDEACKKYTPFTKTTYKVRLENKDIEHDVWSRNLWDYTQDLLRDGRLVSQMEWDAQRLSRRLPNGTFEQFYDEPYTAERFWEVQSKIPQGGKPFGLIVYADKSKLSSFGTAKAHPVIVRCANLPAAIRNGNGPGGGRIIGWLPIVKESGKKNEHVTYKRVVWHKGLQTILLPVRDYTYTGVHYVCGDEERRWIWIFVVIMSADYEEQCYMALIRGVGSNFPCPICLVPKELLTKIWMEHELRTGDKALAVLASARAPGLQVYEREEKLKEWSLRPVDNAFLELNNSDPYLALSFDRLHAFHLGLFGHYFWPLLKRFIEAIPGGSSRVDHQFAEFPRWSGLAHFGSDGGVMTLTFNDGNKFAHLSRCTLFAVHNVVTVAASPDGYLLLCVIRRYVETDMYSGLEVVKEGDIADGQEWQRKLAKGINVRSELVRYKSWEFPKGHTYAHLFLDIIAKGSSKGTDTRPNEGLHGPIKEIYLLRTNFRDVAGQILEIDHQFYVAGHMRADVNHLDAVKAERLDQAKDFGDNDPDDTGHGHFKLRTRQRSQTLLQLQQTYADDPAYAPPGLPPFHVRLSKYLTDTFVANNIPLPGDQHIILDEDFSITEYRLLEVNYESTVDWTTQTDLLRSNPNFFKAPRYDAVLIRTAEGHIFGRILMLFTCDIGGTIYPIALVHPYDASVGNRSKKDRDLGFYRLRARTRSRAEFFSIHSIVRGALLVPDFGKEGDFLVDDLIDTDMFLRMKKLAA